MLEFTQKSVDVVAGCICDRCQKKLIPSSEGWDEKWSIQHQAGYYSVFGDGKRLSLDLCQECILEVLGPWLRIEAHDDQS
jgi:hypothetical protein